MCDRPKWPNLDNPRPIESPRNRSEFSGTAHRTSVEPFRMEIVVRPASFYRHGKRLALAHPTPSEVTGHATARGGVAIQVVGGSD